MHVHDYYNEHVHDYYNEHVHDYYNEHVHDYYNEHICERKGADLSSFVNVTNGRIIVINMWAPQNYQMLRAQLTIMHLEPLNL